MLLLLALAATWLAGPLCAAPPPGDVVLIASNSVWKYSDAGTNQAPVWRTPAFNDAVWASGPGPLGYGELYHATRLSMGADPNRLLTAYFRRVFIVPDAGSITSLTARVLRDDGAVVYLNGTEVFRHNMPAGEVNYYTPAAAVVGGADETTYFPSALNPHLLVSGANVLAVEVHQSSGVSADLSFDLELIGRTGVPTRGQVLGWGSSGWGESVVPPDLGPVVAVSAGMYHSLALKSDGTVVAWGGNGTDYQEVNQVPPWLSNVAAISAGGSISLALKFDGTVVAWGYNGPDGATNVPAGLQDVVAISAGGYHSLALKRNGRVVGWGQSGSGQISPPANLTNAIAIAAGGHHSLALRANGTVVGFGCNGYGESTPPAGLSNVIAIAAGQDFSLVLRAEGTVVAWGRNSDGQTDVPPGLSDVVAISAGGNHSLALKRDGAVVGWGRNWSGETNVPAAAAGALAIDAGSSHCLALVNAAPPIILAQPLAGNTVVAGSGILLHVGVEGGAPLAYQWQRDGVKLTGETNAALYLINLQTGQAGRYRVVVSNGGGSVTSSESVITVLPASVGAGCAGSLDPTFDASPGVWPDLAPQAITSVKAESDGRVIIAGAFEQVQGIEVGSPARLLANGRLDESYVPNPIDVVSHKEITQPDGKRVVIVASEENPFGMVLRYRTDGSLDPGFVAALPSRFDARALALQPDGRILVAGGIYPLEPEDYYDIVPQPVLRLNPDGSLDPSFATNNVVSLCPGEGAEQRLGVYDLVQQPDGKIYVGGFFTAFNGVRRTVVARLNVDGTLDTSFEPDIEVHTGHDAGIVETVTTMAFAPDGKLYVAGFLEYINGLTRRAIARLHTAPDSCPGLVEVVNQIEYVRENQPAAAVSFRRWANTNATAVVGYSTYKWPTHPNPNYHNAYAVAGEDYVEQTNTVTFAPGETLKTVTVPLRDDAQVEPSECFFVNLDYVPGGAVFDDHAASMLVMIWDDEHVGRPGSVDETFINSGWDGAVLSLALSADGTVYVGGVFTQAGGLARQGLARCAPNGYVTPGFAPVLNGSVREVAVEPASGKVVIAGSFTSVNGLARPGFARLNPDGTLDSSFAPSLDGEVWELELMANGQMIIAGPFRNVAGQVRDGFARLNHDGSLDPTFNAGSGIGAWNTSLRVHDLLALPDGKVVVTGWFWNFNGTTRRTVVRLNADGSIDTTFNPTIFQSSDDGYGLLLQPDGKLLVSGWIRYGIGGVYHVGIVRLLSDGSLDSSFAVQARTGVGGPLALQSDGKILLGGSLRLNPDGTEDPTWFAGSSFIYGGVSAMVLLPNGKLIVGGGFPQANGFPYAYLAVLNGDATAGLGEALDTVGLTWTTGSKPWIGQTAVTHDGVDDAQSATNITCDDHSWLKTTVTGPGTISFWWKARVEGAESFAAFYVAGGSGTWPEAAQLNESADWQKFTGVVGPGVHDLFWVTYGNCANASEQITTWLDEVTFVPAPQDSPLIAAVRPPSGPVGTVVAIAGVNFSATPSDQVVYFGATRATVLSASSTLLEVAVPAGATYAPITVTVNGLTAYTRAPYLVTFEGSGGFDSASLAAAQELAVGDGPVQVAIGDWDGDGQSDLAVANCYENTISVFRNVSMTGSLSAASFEAPFKLTTAPGQYSPYRLVGADVDGDGRLDLVTISPGGNTVSVYRNLSIPGALAAGSFAPRLDFPTGAMPHGLAVQDLDGDGRPELATANWTDGTLSILRNTTTGGAITFADPVDFAAGEGAQDLAIGDLDGDGKPDLVTANRTAGTLSVFRNTSTPGLFTADSLAPRVDLAELADPVAVALGDLDGDGKLDLTVGTMILPGAGLVAVYRNLAEPGSLASSSFAPGVAFPAAGWVHNVAISDLDGDGRPDVALNSELASQLSVFRNLSSPGSFSSSSLAARVDFATGWNAWGLAIGDLDGDGRPDVALGNTYDDTIALYRNTVAPPGAPVITGHPVSQTKFAGETATFSVAAAGTPPLSYQWLVNGSAIPDATNSSLTVNNVQPAQSGQRYAAWVSNAFGSTISSEAVLTVLAQPDFGEALEAPAGLVWRTGGNAPWTVQTGITHDGVDAAGGVLSGCELSSWLETTVVGPGTVSFWWKVDNESGEGLLDFGILTNGQWAAIEWIYAGTDWNWRSYSLPPGPCVLRWIAWGSCISDTAPTRAYVDQVGVSTATFVMRQLPARGEPFTVRLAASPAPAVAVYAVQDQPPAGWSVNNISHGGVFDPITGQVKFGPFYDATVRLLTYEVVWPACAQGTACFLGHTSADGVSSSIGGDQCLASTAPHPADLSPPDWRLDMDEVTAYGAAWRRGQSWPVSPLPIPIDYVTRAAALWQGGECYTVDARVTNAPLWWVNCDAPPGAASPLAASPAVHLPAAQRQMPSGYVPGEPLTVTIATLPGADVRAYAAEDTVPAGWAVTHISHDGEWDAVSGKVRWGPFVDRIARTLSYQLTPPAAASGSVSITGAASFDGVAVPISGAHVLSAGGRLTLVHDNSTGRMQIRLSGPATARILIEISDDLSRWTPLREVSNFAGYLEFSDADAANHPNRFYRVRVLD